jgi:methionyl-tRNA synthetase
MTKKYFDGIVPTPEVADPLDDDLKATVKAAIAKSVELMNGYHVADSLDEIFAMLRRANKYIDETMPWALAKDESKKGRLATVMYNLAECVRIISVLIAPVMTKSPAKIQASLGVDESLTTFDSIQKFGGIKPGSKITKAEVLFPRIDIEAEFKAQEEEKAKKEAEEAKKKAEEEAKKVEEISIDQFASVQLKTAKVLTAEKLEKSDKLLVMTLHDGERERTVVSGIAKHYTPEEMVGKTVVLVANLKPAKLRGVLSEGMILCAEDENGNLSLVFPEKAFGAGCEVR